MAVKNLVDISVVVPVFNEEMNIDKFAERTIWTLSQITSTYEIIFVLDPSPDQSEAKILNLAQRNNRIKLLKMSRRFGQPAATTAGLAYSQGERIVVIDADLQDPPELILNLYEKMNEGYDVVYATRRHRSGENFIKKLFSKVGYRLIDYLSDIDIPRDTGDFRIMSRRVVNELCNLTEKHGFLRGLVAYIGFNQTGILYDRDSRTAGNGNYNRFTGSFKIGLNGLIGFSSKPLNLMSIAGGIIAALSFALGLWYAIQKLFGFSLSPGLPTTVILVSFFAGIQLLSLGLLGEYISRIYEEVKRRPVYIVDKEIGF